MTEQSQPSIYQNLLNQVAALQTLNLKLEAERDELRAENKRLNRDNGFAVRIMEAIRKYSEGDKDALAGMGVPWVDELLAENERLKKLILAYGANPAGFDWEILKAVDECDELRKLADQLAAALKPFAWCGEKVIPAAEDNTQVQLCFPHYVGLPYAGSWRQATLILAAYTAFTQPKPEST